MASLWFQGRWVSHTRRHADLIPARGTPCWCATIRSTDASLAEKQLFHAEVADLTDGSFSRVVGARSIWRCATTWSTLMCDVTTTFLWNPTCPLFDGP